MKSRGDALSTSPLKQRQVSESSPGSRGQHTRNRGLARHGRTMSTSTTTTTALSSSLGSILDPTVAAASITATAQLVCSLVWGALAARRGPKVLNKTALQVLSKLIYHLFQPAFLFTSVASTFHQAALAAKATSTTTTTALSGSSLALMPLAATLQITLGYLLGRGLTKWCGVPSSQTGLVHMCTAFANSGPLPLIFVSALLPPHLQTPIVACISFYLLAWSPLFWTVGKIILGTSDSPDENSSKLLVNAGSERTVLSMWKDRIQAQVKSFLSPPVVGSLLGLAVGLTSPVRNALLGPWGKPVWGSLQTLGRAYLPGALLVLAGSLAAPKAPATPPPAGTTNTTSSAVTGSIPTPDALSPRTILAISIARFVLSPLLAFALTCGLLRGLPPGLAGGSSTMSTTRILVSFGLLLEGCMPPAQNSVILLQLAQRDQQAQQMARLLTYLYALGVIPVTILMTVCLSMSGMMTLL